MPRQTGPRINQQIRAPRVVVVDDEGNRLGVFQPGDALTLARERGLDLVEVAPDAQPPVCRLADYGRLKFEASKKRKAARRNSKATVVKQLKLRPKTHDHDMDVRIRKAIEFLEAGHMVRVVVWFRGREHAHHDIGAEQCLRIAEACKDLARIDQPPRMEGRNMTMLLSPLR